MSVADAPDRVAVASVGSSKSAISSGKITLTVSDPVIKKGEVFTVVCRVSASTGVSEADFFVDYNTSVLKFVEGGARAAGRSAEFISVRRATRTLR